MPRKSELDKTELEEAEYWVYVSQRLFPEHEMTKKLKALFVNNFGPVLEDRGSKEEFQFQLRFAREQYNLDFTKIADILDPSTVEFLKKIDAKQFKFLYDKSTGQYRPLSESAQYMEEWSESELQLESMQGEISNIHRDYSNPFVELTNRLRILVNRLNYWRIQQGPKLIKNDNIEIRYLLNSEDFLVNNLFSYREKEIRDGVEGAEDDLEDLKKILFLVTPENPMVHIEEMVEGLEKLNSESIELSGNDAIDILQKLKNEDFKPSEEEHQIMDHPSFKRYKSDFIKLYREKYFESALERLKSNNKLSFVDFHKICNTPSEYFRKPFQNSFKFACQKNGSLSENLKGKKVMLGTVSSSDVSNEKLPAFLLIS